MNCKNCGAPLDSGARFCRKCGTSVPEAPEQPARPSVATVLNGFVSRIRPVFRNKKLLLLIGICAAALALALILILSLVSCRPMKLETPEAVADAVLRALERGDGDALQKMTELSEAVCGAHPELFGEGDTPHAVMKTYYRTLADTHSRAWKDAYGKDFRLEAQLTTERYTDTDVFEINRALDLDAAQYAVLKGPLLVNGSAAGSISITAVEWNGAWQPLIVYLY